MPRRTPPSCQIAAGSLNPSCQSGASRFFPLRSPVRVHLVPGFRFLLFLRPLFLPRPLPTVLFSTVASIAESHNAWSKLFCATTQSTYSNASRSPPARSNRFRPCVVFGLLFSDFFFLFFFFLFFLLSCDCQTPPAYRSARDGRYQSNKVAIVSGKTIDSEQQTWFDYRDIWIRKLCIKWLQAKTTETMNAHRMKFAYLTCEKTTECLWTEYGTDYRNVVR
jgi:hypothetical protein